MAGLAALRVGTGRPRFLRSPLFIALPTWRARKPRVSLGDPGRTAQRVAAGQGTSSGIIEDVAPLSRDNRLLGHLHGTGVPPVRRRGHPLEPGCAVEGVTQLWRPLRPGCSWGLVGAALLCTEDSPRKSVDPLLLGVSGVPCTGVFICSGRAACGEEETAPCVVPNTGFI